MKKPKNLKNVLFGIGLIILGVVVAMEISSVIGFCLGLVAGNRIVIGWLYS